jgi:uncharacterized protein
MRYRILSTLILIVLLSNCTGKKANLDNNELDLTCQKILAERMSKDHAFLNPQFSPFQLEKDFFTGLKYFECNAEYAVVATLEEADSTDVEVVKATQNETRKYAVAGVLHFDLKQLHCKLKAYFEDSTHSQLFIMFKDLTNHNDTYGGGRYLSAKYSKNMKIVLDFNRAYNPYCHYNHNYSCPVVKGLSLPLRVEAGEKKYW